MERLFDQPQLRLRNGKFCTNEQYRIERIEHENKILRLEREKYYRAWCCSSKRIGALERELNALKTKIKELISNG